MGKKITFFIFILTILSPRLFAVFAEDPTQYPDEVARLIPKAEKVGVCEGQKGVVGYISEKENWVVRVFTKDRKPLEAWVNYGRGLFWEYYSDKTYYFTDDGVWVDADNISGSMAKKLGRRIKFTSEEIESIKKCFSEKK